MTKLEKQLLEALQDLLTVIPHHETFSGVADGYMESIKQAKAAIAKATAQ